MQVTVLPDEVVSHTRWPLASFTGARDFAQEAEPSGPPRCGLGWPFSFCRARSPGRDAVVPDGHGPGRQPLRRRQAPRTPGAGLHQHHIHVTSSGMLPERLLRHTLDFTSSGRSPTIPATGPMPPRSGSSSRPSPTSRSMPRPPAATPRPYSAWPDRNHPTLHPRERPERQTQTTAGARPAGIQSAQICPHL